MCVEGMDGWIYIQFWWGNLREGGHLDDPAADVKIIVNGFSRDGMRGVDWIELAWDRNKWQAVVNTVMNLGDKMRRIS
jgi:hypothetical protein